MAQGYKPYTPEVYGSSEKEWELYSFDIKDLVDKAGNTEQYIFSNPFLILSLYDANAYNFYKMEDIFNTIEIINGIAASTSLPSYINSGVLIQQYQQGAGNLTYTAQQPVSGNPYAACFLIDLVPKLNYNTQIYENTATPFRARNYPRTGYESLNDFKSFDNICFPAGSTIKFPPLIAQPLILTMAVKRGNNQPFFSYVP